ncbi:MAG: polyprenyl synthetase family protein [Phycisphaerales bacterium JB065]
MPTLVDIAPAPAPVADLVAAGLVRAVEIMHDQLRTPVDEVEQLVRLAERYHGKMLRPAIAMVSALASQALSGSPEPIGTADPRFQRVATVGGVIELIHLATLVHDDVLDHAEERRGGPSVNALKGNEQSVILGDYLLSKAFHLCAKLDAEAGTHCAVRVGEITSTVCEGEILQLSHRGDAELTRDTYFDIIERKTAALIAVACELGALLAGAPQSVADALYRYGMNIGTAFQIQDDLLDLVGEQRLVGKPLGRDLELGKLTLPLIHFLESGGPEAQSVLAQVRSGAHLNQVQRSQLVRRIEETGSIEYARGMASDLVSDAKVAVEILPDSPAKAYLLDLASAVIERAF